MVHTRTGLHLELCSKASPDCAPHARDASTWWILAAMPDAGARGAETVRQALDQTLEAHTAWFELHMKFRPPEIPKHGSPDAGSLHAGVLTAVVTVPLTVVRTAFRFLVRRSLSAEGVIDLAGRRLMMDFGSYAVVVAEGRRWSGRSGRAISTLPPDVFPEGVGEPFWMLDVPKGVTEAQPAGRKTLGAHDCQCLSARCDFGRAAKASPELVLPPAKRYEDLLAVPIHVCIDEKGCIRRVRFESEMLVTLDLLEYGVELPADWSRLPTFRSPGDGRGSKT